MLRCWLAGLLLLSAGVAAQSPSAAREEEQRRAEVRLEAVRGQIAELAREQDALAGERDGAARELRAADRSIGEATAALRALDADLSVQQQSLQALEAEQAALERRLAEQRESLSALLRATHAQGRHASLKLLLAQDRADALGRTLVYLGYFRQARTDRIRALLDDLAALAQARAAVAAQQDLLRAARDVQQAALASLDAERADRRSLLEALEKRFRDSRARLTALGRDEAALVALLKRLQDIFVDIPQRLDGAAPFASLAGRLPWPTAGKLRTGFGRPLPDGRQSSGWLIAASAGQEVRAVAHGRVAFADWMKGFGLIAIIDHGDGYMSLYASNDALLREVGDWVQAGDVIASAGSSGGQQEAGVYFELRRAGRPVDPARWLRRP